MKANLFAQLMFNRNTNTDASRLIKGKTLPKKERKWICKYSKEQILQMRSMHEFEGFTVKQVAEHFHMSYGDASRYLTYTTQRDLVPKRPEK